MPVEFNFVIYLFFVLFFFFVVLYRQGDSWQLSWHPENFQSQTTENGGGLEWLLGRRCGFGTRFPVANFAS
jgi:hypothetical protein